uniref:Uncharacterized protein n=1 Tax=Macrostomum lignano TaxID=282301 RepID=A0A1I8FYS0_9PLAT
MTRHFSNVGIFWQRTVLLALVFICTVLIIYQIDPSYDLNDSKVEFYEDFGDKASKKEVLINSDSENKENSLDLPVEAEKVPEPTPTICHRMQLRLNNRGSKRNDKAASNCARKIGHS